MATIRPRKQADGSTRFTPIVRIRSGKTIVYREYKTFGLRSAAARSFGGGVPAGIGKRVRSLPPQQDLALIGFDLKPAIPVDVLQVRPNERGDIGRRRHSAGGGPLA